MTYEEIQQRKKELIERAEQLEIDANTNMLRARFEHNMRQPAQKEKGHFALAIVIAFIIILISAAQ